MEDTNNSSALPPIEVSVVVRAPVDKVWQAVATAEGLGAWFMHSTLEPVIGHAFVLHAGPYGDSPCRITDLDPPHRIGFDWDEDWHLTISLQPVDPHYTQVTLTHDGWSADKTTRFGQPHTVVRRVMEEGWTRKVKESLPAYVER